MDNMYYRPSRGYGRRSRRARVRKIKFMKPLLFILAIIVFFWILAQIWGFFSNLISSDLDSPAQVYIVEGKTQILSFGSGDYAPLLSGQALLEGDRVRTLTDSRAVVEFYDGTILRMDEGTDLMLEEVDKGKNEGSILVRVNTGDVWVNKPSNAELKSNVVVTTDYLKVNADSTIFAMRAGLPESVRVVDENLLVEVLEEGQSLDQIEVSVGQELILTSDAYDAFLRRETPSVLDALDINFQQNSWYKFNTDEDASPSQFAVDPALSDGSGTVIESENPLEGAADDFVDSLPDDNSSSAALDSPQVTSPSQGSTQNSETIDILGNAPVGAEKIMVTSFEEGSPNPYVLKGFTPGDSTFRYIATFDGGNGNLVIGENRFEIVAIDAEGNESPTSTLVFDYELAADAEVETPDVLSAPEIVMINDQPAGEKFILEEDRAVVIGSVGTWATDVVVNNYTLREFTPNSGTFTYILSNEFGNLSSGENVLEVYAKDKSGTKSEVLEFVVSY